MTEKPSNEQTTSQDWKSILAEWRTLQQSVGISVHVSKLPPFLFIIPFAIVGIAVLRFSYHHPNVDILPLLAILVAALVMPAVGAGFLEQQNARIKQSEAKLLVDLNQLTDVDALVPVMQAFRATRSYSGRLPMQKMVLGLLERQTPEHHAVLTATEQRLLGALLEYGSHSPQTRMNSGGNVPLLDSAADVQLQRAVLRVLPFLSDQAILPALARMIARDAPSREGPAVREEARQVMSARIATLDFGSVAKIPYWIERLPVLREARSETAEQPVGSSWDDCMIAVCALTRLLSQLTAAHGVLIDARARKRLREAPRTIHFILGAGMDLPSIIASRLGPDFTLAVLGALELFGTSEDLPFVRYWANMGAPTPDLERIRHRARQVVPVLTARQKQEELSLSLLRGSSAPPAPANQLLRPATGHTATEAPNELLRPHDASSPVRATDTSITNRGERRESAIESAVSNGADTRAEGTRPALNARSVTEAQPVLLRQSEGGE